MSNIGEEIARLEQENLDYKKERQLKKEYNTKIKNLKINCRNKIIIAFLTGAGIATILCNGKEIMHSVGTVVDKAIEADNEAFEKEMQAQKDYVQRMTGKTIDEIVNGSVDHQALTDAYNAGYNDGIEKGKEIRNLDKENDTYNDDKDLSSYIENERSFETNDELQTYRSGYSAGLSEGYTKGPLAY